MKQTCLSCKYYKISDHQTGLCREQALTTKNRNADKPEVTSEHCCDKWIDCGQTYYIRLGWIKKNAPEEG